VAIDGGPARQRPQPPRPGARAWFRHHASLGRKSARAARSWVVARPRNGRDGPDDDFVAYFRWAARFHRPGPTTFPSLLVHGDDGSVVGWPTPPDRVVVVGGDHVTILHPPNVAAVAALVSAEFDAAFSR
jgi:hypothetical protein